MTISGTHVVAEKRDSGGWDVTVSPSVVRSSQQQPITEISDEQRRAAINAMRAELDDLRSWLFHEELGNLRHRDLPPTENDPSA